MMALKPWESSHSPFRSSHKDRGAVVLSCAAAEAGAARQSALQVSIVSVLVQTRWRPMRVELAPGCERYAGEDFAHEAG